MSKIEQRLPLQQLQFLVIHNEFQIRSRMAVLMFSQAGETDQR
jgi:hypothetical protein